MANCEEARFKLTNTKLIKSKSAAKSKARKTLGITKKNFKDVELLHELFLTKKQTIKIKDLFANNMSTDTKLSKAKLPKVIQSGGFLHGIR